MVRIRFDVFFSPLLFFHLLCLLFLQGGTKI
jgi:hypothetical protein